MNILIPCLTIAFPVIVWFLIFLKRKRGLGNNKMAIIITAYFNISFFAISIFESSSFTSIKRIPRTAWILLISYTILLWLFIYPFTKWTLRNLLDKENKK